MTSLSDGSHVLPYRIAVAASQTGSCEDSVVRKVIVVLYEYETRLQADRRKFLRACPPQATFPAYPGRRHVYLEATMSSSQKPANSSLNSRRAVEDLALRPLLGVVEVAQILGLPRATLYRWHSLSTPETPIGPRAFRVGRHLRYTLGDVSTYIAELRASAS